MSVSTEAKGAESFPKEANRQRRHLAVPVLVLALTSLVLAACGPKEGQGVATARITSPRDGDTVKFMDTVEGTVDNLHKDSRVWVAVTDSRDTIVHPQERPVVLQGNSGRWIRDKVRFGNNEIPAPGEDTTHRISVLIANSDGNRELERYMINCQTQNICPGYNPSELPSGITLQPNTITVHRDGVVDANVPYDLMRQGLILSDPRVADRAEGLTNVEFALQRNTTGGVDLRLTMCGTGNVRLISTQVEPITRQGDLVNLPYVLDKNCIVGLKPVIDLEQVEIDDITMGIVAANQPCVAAYHGMDRFRLTSSNVGGELKLSGQYMGKIDRDPNTVVPRDSSVAPYFKDCLPFEARLHQGEIAHKKNIEFARLNTQRG